MTTPPEPLDLGRWFPAVQHAPDADAWLGLAERALKGRPLAGLTRPVADGVRLEPIAHGSARDAIPRGRSGPWQIRQELALEDLDAAVQAVGEAVEGEVDCVWLRGDLADREPAELGRLLGSMDLPRMAVSVDARGSVVETLERLLGASPVAAAQLRATVSFAPIARALKGEGVDFAGLARCVERVVTDAPGVKVLVLDGLAVAEAGGDAVDELGFVLASFADVARGLEDRGLALSRWLPHTEVRLSLGRDLLVDLAKLRALRLVWGRLLAACDITDAPLFLHARMTDGGLTRRDPWTNLLRATQAGFAGAVGGADAITLLPHDHALGESSTASRRVARNLHLLLREESHLDRVDDPAAGSGTIESLTQALARAGWARMQAMEAAGGVSEAIRAGSLQRTLAARAEALEARVRSRRDVVVGVNRYPDTQAEAPAPARRPEGAGVYRRSASWEALASAVQSEGHGVFLVKLGPVPSHSARAGFARDLFASGGFGVHDGDAHDDPDAAATAFGTSACRVACICGADSDYEHLVPALARQLAAAGARAVLVAGRWPEPPDPWREAGVTGVVHLGADVYAALADVALMLGVEGTS